MNFEAITYPRPSFKKPLLDKGCCIAAYFAAAAQQRIYITISMYRQLIYFIFDVLILLKQISIITLRLSVVRMNSIGLQRSPGNTKRTKLRGRSPRENYTY